MTRQSSEWRDSAGIRVGSLTLRGAYSGEPDRIAIYQESGEGGDFPVADVEALLQAYYKANF